jgi:CheY-like chemotaxis protein
MSAVEDKSRHIVLMEDNPSDVFLFRRALDQHSVVYTLEVVRDGEKGIGILEQISRGAAALPDIIVLDLNLPRHDGIEVLERCRSLPGLRGLPVMILTSSDSPRERQRAHELDVTDFVRKPIMLDDFMALGGRIKDLLEREPVS